MSACICCLPLGFILGVPQPAITILHGKTGEMRILDSCMESLQHLLLLDMNSVSVRVAAQTFQGWMGLCTEDRLLLIGHHFQGLGGLCEDFIF